MTFLAAAVVLVHNVPATKCIVGTHWKMMAGCTACKKRCCNIFTILALIRIYVRDTFLPCWVHLPKTIDVSNTSILQDVWHKLVKLSFT